MAIDESQAPPTIDEYETDTSWRILYRQPYCVTDRHSSSRGEIWTAEIFCRLSWLAQFSAQHLIRGFNVGHSVPVSILHLHFCLCYANNNMAVNPITQLWLKRKLRLVLASYILVVGGACDSSIQYTRPRSRPKQWKYCLKTVSRRDSVSRLNITGQWTTPSLY